VNSTIGIGHSNLPTCCRWGWKAAAPPRQSRLQQHKCHQHAVASQLGTCKPADAGKPCTKTSEQTEQGSTVPALRPGSMQLRKLKAIMNRLASCRQQHAGC